MSDIKKSFSDLIGNTPLYAAEKFAAKAGANAQVLAKLEYFNPAGSVKDRIANAMINEAEKSGALKPGATHYRTDLRQHWYRSGSSCSFPRLPHHPHHAGNHER